VDVDEVAATGGLPHRNPLLMQIYADVLGRPIRLTESSQCSALGAALLGGLAAAVFAGPAEGQRRLVRFSDVEYQPRESAQEVYRRLYDIYFPLPEAFGLPAHSGELGGVMHDLLDLRLGRALVR